MFYCKNCGSSDVESKAWIKMNTKEFVDYVDEFDDEIWCNGCDTDSHFTTDPDEWKNNDAMKIGDEKRDVQKDKQAGNI